MRLKTIRIKSDGKTLYPDQVQLIEDIGIEGDDKGQGGDRQISILSSHIRKLVDGNPKEGLCLYRFYENFTIEELRADDWQIGDHFRLGSALLEVSSKEKRCYPDCKLIKRGQACLLLGQVLYARVIKTGIIKIGDKISPE